MRQDIFVHPAQVADFAGEEAALGHKLEDLVEQMEVAETVNETWHLVVYRKPAPEDPPCVSGRIFGLKIEFFLEENLR